MKSKFINSWYGYYTIKIYTHNTDTDCMRHREEKITTHGKSYYNVAEANLKKKQS